MNVRILFLPLSCCRSSLYFVKRTIKSPFYMCIIMWLCSLLCGLPQSFTQVRSFMSLIWLHEKCWILKLFFWLYCTLLSHQNYMVCYNTIQHFFFAKTWWISMKNTCMKQPWTFIFMHEFSPYLSIALVDGKQLLSEVVFNTLIRFILYTMSTNHRVKESPKSTTVMSAVTYVMLYSTRDRSCGQQAIGTSITTMLQHITRTWFRLFCQKPGSLLSWYGTLQHLAVPAQRSDTFLTMKIRQEH